MKMSNPKEISYEESRTKYFRKKIKSHERKLDKWERSTGSVIVKHAKRSRQGEIIQYYRDALNAFDENNKLLKGE